MAERLKLSETTPDYWYLTKEELPESGVEVMGFNKEWIDEDFNPDGTRGCWVDDDEVWVSAAWCNTMDHWQTLASDSENTEYSPYNNKNADAPTYWTPKPKPPKD